MSMLQTVAAGLKDLKDRVVFVGGAVAELYATDPARTEIRATQDVDCVIEITSRARYYALEDQLRKLGFVNDTSADAPICRWIYKGIKVDVMPTSETVLGFSNIWNNDGIVNKVIRTLPNGEEVSIFTTPYFVASKLEALKNPGGNDLRLSHDFEDIIYIVDNCVSFRNEVSDSEREVKDYLRWNFKLLLENPNINEAVECALPYGTQIERIEKVKETIKQILEL
jgi:predicted nucleotidyltransferase